MHKHYNNVILFSGGLDCVALLVLMNTMHSGAPLPVRLPSLTDTCLLFVNYGQVAANQELEASQYWTERYKLPLETTNDNFYLRDLNPRGLLFGNGSDHVLHMRNSVLAFHGVRYGNRICFGFSDESPAKMPDDTTVEWVNSMDLAFSLSKPGTSVVAPLIKVPKLEVLTWANKYDRNLFSRSVTCWTPRNDGEGCGTCGHCTKKADLMTKIKRTPM